MTKTTNFGSQPDSEERHFDCIIIRSAGLVPSPCCMCDNHDTRSFCSSLRFAQRLATDHYSVLPPPPRYPIGGPYGATGITGIVPMIETNNTISNPTGPEWQFLVGEGGLQTVVICYFAMAMLMKYISRHLRPQGRLTPRNTSSTSIRSPHRQSESASHQPATCIRGYENDTRPYSVPAAAILLQRAICNDAVTGRS